MAIRRLQITTCDLCGTEQETELFPKIATETGGWFTFTVRNAKDLREKIECAVCATCAERISDLKREREAEKATGIVPGPATAPGANQEPAPGATPATNAASKKHGAEAEKPNPPPGPDPAFGGRPA
jgi:hypothetical protein